MSPTKVLKLILNFAIISRWFFLLTEYTLSHKISRSHLHFILTTMMKYLSVSYTSNLVMARNVRKKLQVSNKMFKNPLKLYHAFPNKKNWLSDEYFSQIIDYMLFNDVNTLSSNFINYYLCLQNAMVAYGNVFCIILHPILFFSFLNFFYILWSRYNYFIIKKKNIKDTYLPLKSYKFPPKAVSWTLYYIYIYISM